MRLPARLSVHHQLWLFLLLFIAAQGPAVADTYRLDAGDTIKINVFQEPELSIEAKITASGIIDYPLIGALNIAGRTLIETEQLLDQKLRGDYLIDPQISVSVVSYRPFFITGAVKSPGSYEYQPGLSVRQAVVIAGDFSDRASRSKIYIIREDTGNQDWEKVELNDPVGPGDTITVRESLF